MRNIIIDSSSAILLFKCGMISPLLKYCAPAVPETVFSELTVAGYDGADLFTELRDTGMLKVYRPERRSENSKSGALHAGEYHAISLFFEGRGDFIIMDDGRGGAFCRDNGIPYINALLTVKILFLKNIITESGFTTAWNWLLTNGRYSEKVKERAESAGSGELGFFL